MRALILSNSVACYKEDIKIPKLTDEYNVLVKVHYAGICRTDIGIADGVIPAKDGVILGHEFCGEIVGFVNNREELDGWVIGAAVSVNPMQFGKTDDLMCGKDCDGAFSEYIAAPSKALIGIARHLLSPLGAFLEPVAAALAPLKFIEKHGDGAICIFGDNRIAELTFQVAHTMGVKGIELKRYLEELIQNHYDCIVETEAEHIDAYAEALKPGGMLILKSRSYKPTSLVANTIAMKEIRVQGARYGDFHVASHILSATASGLQNTLDTNALFGNIYELKDFRAAFADAESRGSKKIFFRICAES